MIANEDGSKLYVTVGSNSNVAENGIGTKGAVLVADDVGNTVWRIAASQ